MRLISRIKQGFGDLCHIWADEMRTVFKDEGVLIFFILVPLFYPLLYSWIYTNEVVREVPVAVVDLSHSAMIREFIRQFDASPDVRVARYCTNLDEAKDVVGRQDAFGVIYFPTDFQTRVSRMEQSPVSVFCDMSFMLYYKAIFQTATAVAGNVNSKILIERAGNWTEREDEITAKPLDFDEVQLFNSTGGYGNFIIPGVLMLIIQQTLLLGVGLSVGTARERSKTGSFLPDAARYDGVFRTVLGRALAYFRACSAAFVRLYVVAASRRYVLVHVAIRPVVRVLRNDNFRTHPLPRERHSYSGVHVSAAAFHFRRIMAAECHSAFLAVGVVACAVHVRRARLCKDEHYGCPAGRCKGGVCGPMGADDSLFLHHLPALPMAGNQEEKG